MSYGPYYDPTGRTQFIKGLWKTTNARNDAHVKMMDEIAAEKRRLNRDSCPGPSPVTYGGQRSGGGGFFWLAVLAVVGGVLLHLL